VAVVGAFTGGQAVALKPSLAEPGSFYLDYTLPQGKIQFHYVVDGSARVDPDEATTADGKANERHVERDLFAALNNIMKQRIMVIDGAMGTMIQRHKLQEEDYRSAGEAALCEEKGHMPTLRSNAGQDADCGHQRWGSRVSLGDSAGDDRQTKPCPLCSLHF
jgi:hypothetical protein